MDPIPELNPDTVSLDGLHVIEAGAGTGKTYNITKLYRRLILEGVAEVSQILVVTFTEAATIELRTRLQKELEEWLAKNQGETEERKHCRKALADFDNAPVFTIHGFCRRMLQDHTLESGLRDGLELMGTSEELLQEICQDFYRKYIYGSSGQRLALWKELELTPENFLGQTKGLLGKKNIDWPEGCELPENLEEELRQRESLLTQEGEEQEQAKASYGKLVLRAALAYGEEHFARAKKEKGVLTYDDLLTEMERCLAPPRGEAFEKALSKQFRYVFVDEFQDTDDIQNNIFTLAFRKRLERETGRGMFLIGDPKQAIYAFRRGDVYTYLDATKEGEKHQLTCNWRSSPEFIQALNALREKRENFFEQEEISFPEIQIPRREEDNAAPHLYRDGQIVQELDCLLNESFCQNKDNAFLQMGKEIQAMVQERRLSLSENGKLRPLKYSDIALLCTTNNALAEAAGILRAQGLPCVLYQSVSLFGTPEAKELQRCLQAVRSPGDASQRMPFLLSSFFPAFHAKELLYLSRQLLPLPQKLRELQEIWQKDSFPAMFSQFLDAPLREYLGTEPLESLGWDPEISLAQILRQGKGQQSLATYWQLRDALHQAVLSQRLGPEGMMKFLQKRIQNAKKEEEKYPLGLTTEEDAVRLLTIHKSKGLEFPIVYVQGILSKTPKNNGRHHVGKNGKWEAHYDMTGEEEAMAKSKMEDLQENLRLFYVAITRAKFLCRLLEGKKSTRDNPLHSTLGENLLPSFAVTKEGANDFLAWLRAASQGGSQPSGESAAVPRPTLEVFRGEKEEEIPLPRGLRSCSFSTLSQKGEPGRSEEEEQEVEDREDTQDNPLGGSPDSPEEESRSPEGEPIFRFPRGARAGTCWHEILETLDFTQPVTEQKSLWLGKLENYAQFPASLPKGERESRENAFQEMLEGLMETPLPNPECPEGQELPFSLKDISMAQRQSEFRFEYRLPDAASLETLNQQWKDRRLGIHLPPPSSFHEKERWIFNGSLDLLFQGPKTAGGKIYIVDWKTNILGGKRESFSREGMKREMEKNQYTLQYLFYTVAFLHAYQQLNPGWPLTEESYHALFGGVVYCFLRGIRKGQKDHHGFYAVRPDFSQIEVLFRTLAPIAPQRQLPSPSPSPHP